jgi:hypothetical protein|tara:strand:- start:89 stop:355 length:267 start_codon:yes stop_codon:yes gene_type:complete
MIDSYTAFFSVYFRDLNHPMDYKPSMQIISFIAMITLVAILAWLTTTEDDPCANPQADITGSVLADDEGDQDALINRAIIVKGKCKEP